MINLYNQKEIEILKEGGKLLASILDNLVKETKEGVTSIYLNKKAAELIKEKGAHPSFLGYRNFPAVLCVSVNEELVHGLPKNRRFEKGDLVSLDLGIRYKRLCLDKSTTFMIRDRDSHRGKEKFLETIKKALDLGIEKAKAGNHLGEISFIIQKTIKEEGYGLVRNLSGHGVGKKVHEEPKVPNFGRKNEGPILEEGMVLAIEPMASMGKEEIKIKKDDFTIVCADGSPTAHFEDTIAITKKGPIILTRI